MGRRPEINWEPVKALFISGKTCRELSIIFGISNDVIRQQSMKDGWGALRKQVQGSPLPTGRPLLDKNAGNKFVGRPLLENVHSGSKEIGSGSQMPNLIDSPISSPKDDAVSRAIRLRSSDNFRERVISQADKALATLEKAVVNNVFETDRFAEALTKVERIGARAYGYDRESDHPIINIGILGSGSEYDPL